MLSRLPAGPNSTFETTQSLDAVVNMIQDEQLEHSPILAADILKVTKEDSTLKKVMDYIQNGWPKARKAVNKDLQAYFDHKDELTIHNECILRVLRVITPQSLCERALTEIHVSHAGVIRMKSITRLHVWWPNLDREIENCAKQCISCQENHKNPPKAQLYLWETAIHP